MTSRVIDAAALRCLAEAMKDDGWTGKSRFDRTVRAVMWLDAFLSLALVAVCIVASPVFATVGVPAAVRFGLGLTALACAVLLAAFGAITAVLLMLRMRAGQYLLPADLRLPLPRPMRPSFSSPKSHPATTRRRSTV